MFDSQISTKESKYLVIVPKMLTSNLVKYYQYLNIFLLIAYNVGKEYED